MKKKSANQNDRVINHLINELMKVLTDDQFIIDLRDSGCRFQPVRFRNLANLNNLHGDMLRVVSRSSK